MKPWGTCHAVLAAKPYIHGPFAVINADDYYGPEAFKVIYDYLDNCTLAPVTLKKMSKAEAEKVAMEHLTSVGLEKFAHAAVGPCWSFWPQPPSSSASCAAAPASDIRQVIFALSKRPGMGRFLFPAAAFSKKSYSF